MKKHNNKRNSLKSAFFGAVLLLLGAPCVAQAQSTVSSFSLMNADTDNEIQKITDGMTLNLAGLPTRNISIRANSSPSQVGSVRFGYDGVTSFHTESIVPYAINGDTSGDFPPFNLTVGQHTLTGTAFSGSGATGTAQGSFTVTFSVTDSTNPNPVPTGSVTVKPTQRTDVIANPGIGWYSTDKVDSDSVDAQGFPIKVAYVKYYWKDLETGDGVFNWSRIDGHLNAAKAAGQKLAFRIVTSDNVESAPLWLRNQGVPGFVYSTPQDGGNTNRWVPNFDNSTVQTKHFAFIDALAKRYNGNPDVASVDIGTIGLWGEWHYWATSPQVPMPTTTTLHKVIDRYVLDFNKTPLVQQIAPLESLKYAASKGVGVRADCLGSWTNLMPQVYYPAFGTAGVSTAWQKAPVLFESCGTISSWVSQGFSPSQILNWALSVHASGFNNKNSTVPSSAMSAVQNFLLKAGYRYVIRQLSHAASVKAGGTFNLLMDIENVGVAPSYGNYNLAVQLRNSVGTAVWTWTSPTTVKGWLPGLFQVSQSVTLPSSVAAGKYTVAIGLVDSTGTPKIQFASSGKDSKGWYPYTSITVN